MSDPGILMGSKGLSSHTVVGSPCRSLMDIAGLLRGDLPRLAVRQIFRHWRRYRGVVLGLAFGIAGLVVIATTGKSVINDLCDNLEDLADARILWATWDNRKVSSKEEGHFFPWDVEALKRIEGVRSVSHVVWGSQIVTRKAKTRFTDFAAVDADFFRTFRMSIDRGRKICPRDVDSRYSVCVVGPELVKTFFEPTETPVGEIICINGHPFLVIGVLGGLEIRWLWNCALVPLSLRSQFPLSHAMKKLHVRAINWEVVPLVGGAVRDVLVKSRPSRSSHLLVEYDRERIRKINQAVCIITRFLYISVVASVLLGGVGITTAMSSAVAERTVEIGLKRALGATDAAIMNQFLLEAIALAIWGVGLGIVLGCFTVEALHTLFDLRPDYSRLLLTIVAGACGATCLGVLAGYIPARKAANLDPVEAMRFE
ncbi:MAG: ABC transporter permease [Thermodesulfobacteriota bacterium]